MICADDSGSEACSACVESMPSRRTALVMIATKTSFVRFSLFYLPSFIWLTIPEVSITRGILRKPLASWAQCGVARNL